MEILKVEKIFKREANTTSAFSNLSLKIKRIIRRSMHEMTVGTTTTNAVRKAAFDDVTVLPIPFTAASRTNGIKHKNQFSRTAMTKSVNCTTSNAQPLTADPKTQTKAAASTTSNTCCHTYRTMCNNLRRLTIAVFFLALTTKGFSSSTQSVNTNEFYAMNASTMNAITNTNESEFHSIIATIATTTAQEEARVAEFTKHHGTTTTSRMTPTTPMTATNKAAATNWQSGSNRLRNEVADQQYLDSTIFPLPATTTTSSSAPSSFSSATPNMSSIPEKRLWQPITAAPSFFNQFAKRLSSGNELWDGIISDCYEQPTFSCFQKNVFTYLNDALDANDVNVTQRLKFFRNQIKYDHSTTEGSAREGTWVTTAKAGITKAKDMTNERNCDHCNGHDDNDAEVRDEDQEQNGNASSEGVERKLNNEDEHLLENEIPHEGRAAPDTPIEEVTNALYSKSVKFALTHDIEIRLPEVLFDGATFRISPRSLEGNGMIAKLELIPKQEVEARLAGKILMKKIQKFLRSKILLSFLALLLIIKIIKIKLFWILPVIIGVGAAKKVLLKFLLFLFPALTHLFKLCSYYHQTYHSTKYHHHHHLINHQHTIVPPWQGSEHHSAPEIIYTSPPKGLPHGASTVYIHEASPHGDSYGGPYSSHEHYDDGWVNSGPGLGSEYISDINRVAQVDDNSNYFKPHTVNDANELSTWGLGPAGSPSIRTSQRVPATQQQRPPIAPINRQQQQQLHGSSHGFNPFVNSEKQSILANTIKRPPLQHQKQYQHQQQQSQQQQQQQQHKQHQQQQQASVSGAVYAPAPPPRQGTAAITTIGNGLNAAQIAAQYEPSQQQQQQLQNSPLLSAQLKEALRIQAEQRIVAQQQKILEKQPFAQDGQPIMPKNYDPFYSPILLKIDKIIEQLGVKDNFCKERLICSMYKDPNRYSPHSNFVSAELSRDTSELQPVTNTNAAVIRFYRLIQAARDGQDQKDCLRIYAECNINTE